MPNFYLDFEFKWESLDGRTTRRSNDKLPANLTEEEAVAAVAWPGCETEYRVTLVGREWPKWPWPGGYPLYYLTKDGGVLSAEAANEHIERTFDPDDDQFFIVAQDINWEDATLVCDHTNLRIESAYGED